MQEHTKKETDFTKARRVNGVQIVGAAPLAASGAEAVRDAHINLVRAEQNLLSLIQANQATSGTPFGPSIGFGYPGQPLYPTAFAAPSFGAGYPASPGFGSASALSYGFVPGANTWAPWSGAVPTGTGAVRPGLGIGANGFMANAGVMSGLMASRVLACDIMDEGKQFVCQLELPGIEAEQVELLCLERAVAINAFRESAGDIANIVQSERNIASQQRIIALPDAIQPETCKATLTNGILTIVLPKLHPTEGPRRVTVQG